MATRKRTPVLLSLLLVTCTVAACTSPQEMSPTPPATSGTAVAAETPTATAARPPRQGRRRLAQPRSSLPDAWATRVRNAQFGLVQESGEAQDPQGNAVRFRVREAPALNFPGWVDSNSPAYWDGDRLVMFNSAFYAVRVTGNGLEDLRLEDPVVCLDCQRGGGRWLEALWHDQQTGTLYGWYHLEPDDLPCLTAPVIGAAISTDGGRTWRDQGPVIENRYPFSCGYQNGYFVGGSGDFTVVLDRQQQYFYFLFSNYGGPTAEQGVAVARGAFAGRGQPGTVFKYFRDGWTEPGVGGRVTPVWGTPTGWAGERVDAYWGPSVHWNQAVGAYVLVMNRTVGVGWEQEGVYLAVSKDLVRWGPPQKILTTDQWYPQVFGLGPQGSDSLAGGTSRLFVGGISKFVLELVE